jgi:hypothetical protein
MKIGFTPIQLNDYIELHMGTNPQANRAELREQLAFAIGAYQAGVHCQCGSPIWIIGSAQAGLGCFTCITRQPNPAHDYEIEVDDDATSP